MELEGTKRLSQWMKEARTFQKDKYEKFNSRKWDLVPRRHLGEKIDAALLEVGYEIDDLKRLANKVLRSVDEYEVRFIYVHAISCEDLRNYVPDVVCVISDGNSTVWIATDCRTYKSWEDYFENNSLPKGWMCYPNNGESYWEGRFIEKAAYLRVAFALTPAARLKALALDALDNVANVVGTVSDIATVASVVAFPVLGFAAVGRKILKKVVTRAIVASVVSNSYTTTRNVLKIADRYKHSQSIDLNNAEARKLWVNVVVHGLSAVTAAGITYKAFSTGSILVSGAAKSAIAVSCGLKVFRVNLVLALDVYYNDSPYGKVTLTDLKRKLLLFFNIVSPQHLLVETLREIDELTSFLNVIGGKLRDYLEFKFCPRIPNFPLIECKPVTQIKQFIQICGKFVMNMNLDRFECLIKQLKESMKCIPENNVEKFDWTVSEAGREFLSAIYKAWQEAKEEVEEHGESKEHLFKRSDLDEEDVRIIFFMLNDLEKSYSRWPISGSILIEKLNYFSSRVTVEACNRTEYVKRVKYFCSFLKKEVENKIFEKSEEKKLYASLNDDHFSVDMENLKSECYWQVIDNFNIEECVKAYDSSSSSNIASVENASRGMSLYFFVERNPKIEISQYLNMLREKTSGKFNFDHPTVKVSRANIIWIESKDEKALATFYTQKRGQKLEIVLTCCSI